MGSEFRFTKEELWTSAIESGALTLKLLSHFKDEKHHVIQTALLALKALVDIGPSISMSQEDTDNNVSQNQEQSKMEEPSHEVLDANWIVLTPNEVQVKLADNHIITARTVTTERELDALIMKMYHCDMVALDCEFMTSKKSVPTLKVLQVAVSRTEGYAIIIDKLDLQVIHTKLKAILEDSTVNYVAWAFKMDALAITAAIGDVQIAPVLDLQSKLSPIATEKLNLFSAITKFASDWEGLGEFQKAKLLGDGFEYHEGKCIWLVDPLPISALVYAIFDVVSLIVLTESTMKYPTVQSHFWPNNFDGETQKAQDRYKQKLGYAGSAAQQRYENMQAQQQQQPTKNENSSPQITSNDHLSLENARLSHSQSTSPSISSIQYSPAHDSPCQNNMKSEGGICLSPVPQKPKPYRQSIAWGDFSKQEHSTYLEKSPRTSHTTPPIKNASTSPRSSFKSPVSIHQSIPNSPRKTPTLSTAGAFTNKPDISKLHNNMRHPSGIGGDQKVTFTNEENVPGDPEITVWQDFAKSTIQEWGKKKDVGIEAFDEMKTVVSPKSSNANIDTSASQPVSEWDKEDERPHYMQMTLRQIPNRNVFSGPKAVNPNGTDDDDDDRTDEKKASGYLNMQFESTPSHPENYENKWQQIHKQNSNLSPLLHLQPSPSSPAKSLSPNAKPYEQSCNDGIEVEDLSIYQDSLYLYSGDVIKICKITLPDELDMIILPPFQHNLTITITFHYIHPNTNGRPRLKGIEFYFPQGDSYVVVVEQACFDHETTIHSKMATLLTHPTIKRVAWLTDSVVNDIKYKTGITLGRTVDMSKKANDMGKPHGQDFQANIAHYLHDWEALEQFNEEKEKYDKSVGKNFSNLWDREKLPVAILEYSSMAGAALYRLYQYPDLKAVSDQPYETA